MIAWKVLGRCGLMGVVFCGMLHGQTICPPTPAYAVCDIQFDLPPGAPQNAKIDAEFRGPSHRTFLVHAFAAGPNRLTVRFSPFEPGTWEFRVSGNVPGFDAKPFQFTATASDSAGWIETANVHHFRYTGGDRAAHLWLGDTAPDNLTGSAFEQWVNDRAKVGVNHVRLHVPVSMAESDFAGFDARVALLNSKQIIADLVLRPPPGNRETRQEYFRYVIARCAARNATWVLLDDFETVDHAHDLLREIAGYLDSDPYHHLRTVGAQVTSGAFADEKWMNVRSYGSPDWAVSAIEDQIYPIPAVSSVHGASADDFRHQLWNASMSGSYPQSAAGDAASLNYLRVWHDLFADTRYWDEEPFFDCDNARGLSLPDTEYILYIEKPGDVTVHFENKHKWSADWINPLTGEKSELKDIKGDVFTGATPDTLHDWVLHIYREGHKESLKSFRFEAREVLMQEIAADPAKVPFEITKPSGDSLALGSAIPFAARLKKETHATRTMVYLWTGEVSVDGEGYRVLGTSATGAFRLPADIIRHFPATLHLRLYGMNALGKLYSLDENYAVNQPGGTP